MKWRFPLWASLLLLGVLVEVVLQVTLGRSSVLEQRRSEVHGWLSLILLLLALLARPLRFVRYRGSLGVMGFVYALTHTLLAYLAVLGGDWEMLDFLSRMDQFSIQLGFVSLGGLALLAVTSMRTLRVRMGRSWKLMHRFAPLLTALAVLHTLWSGVHFGLQPPTMASILLVVILLVVFVLRKAKKVKP